MRKSFVNQNLRSQRVFSLRKVFQLLFKLQGLEALLSLRKLSSNCAHFLIPEILRLKRFVSVFVSGILLSLRVNGGKDASDVLLDLLIRKSCRICIPLS